MLDTTRMHNKMSRQLLSFQCHGELLGRTVIKTLRVNNLFYDISIFVNLMLFTKYYYVYSYCVLNTLLKSSKVTCWPVTE